MGDGGYGLKPSFEIYDLYIMKMMATKMMHQVLNAKRCCLNTSLNSQREKGPNSQGEKVFKMHLLSSPENQEIMRNVDKISKRKEELTKAKSEAYKRFLEEEK